MNQRNGSTVGIVIGIVAVLIIVGGGFLLATRETPTGTGDTNATPSDDETGQSSRVIVGETVITGDDDAMIKYSGAVLAGTSAPLLDFTRADYDAALETDKLVVLYFYATWCPICKEEVSSGLYPAFNGLMTDKVIGFRVNYNDGDTDSFEENLARQFGVGYQHTKVFLKNGERVLKAPDSWSKSRYLDEINKAL